MTTRKAGPLTSMELLCSSLLTHLDSATRVESHCCAVGGRPYYFARSGAPDLVATYAEHPSADGFRILGEVSAKREVDVSFLLGQLDQALRHARTLREREPNETVYALVVNGGRIGEDGALRNAYRGFVERNGLNRDGGVRVVPMASVDIARALLGLEPERPDGRAGFGSGHLAQAFDDMIETLLGPRPTLEPGWMAQVLITHGQGGGMHLEIPDGAPEPPTPNPKPAKGGRKLRGPKG